jgi:zinc protease
MRVILKPTAFTFDDIQLRLVAPGGASLASDDDYPSAYLADAVIRETGVGRLSGARLERWLASTSISMAPLVSDDAITISGSTTPRDLDAFFQLLHLYLTSPRSDTVAFGRYRDRALALLRDRDRDPDVVFRETLASALAGAAPRATWHDARFYERANMTTALDFWTRRVSNAAGFTVVLTGDFTLDRMRPLVARYLASLPSGARERPRDVGRPIVTDAVNRDVDAGVAGTARTAIAFTGPFDITNDAMNALSLVRDVIAQSLQDRLREQLGGTYGVNVDLEVDVVPPARWTIAIDYSAAPERIESLTRAAEAELARLRAHGPNADEFATARAARVRDYDGQIDHNDFWTSELSFHARFGWPLATIAEHPRQAERLTLAELRAACATYIPDGRFVRITMRPRAASAALDPLAGRALRHSVPGTAHDARRIAPR